MVILFISALIGAVIAGLWYSREKQKIRDEYQRQMERETAGTFPEGVCPPVARGQQPQQTVEEHYMFMYKVPDRQINNDTDDYADYCDDGNIVDMAMELQQRENTNLPVLKK